MTDNSRDKWSLRNTAMQIPEAERPAAQARRDGRGEPAIGRGRPRAAGYPGT